MARRKKNMTLEEELNYLEKEIEKTSELLKQLKNRRKEILQCKEEADLKALYEKIQESGKTVAEVLAEISK